MMNTDRKNGVLSFMWLIEYVRPAVVARIMVGIFGLEE